jgi:hypothetical protein
VHRTSSTKDSSSIQREAHGYPKQRFSRGAAATLGPVLSMARARTGTADGSCYRCFRRYLMLHSFQFDSKLLSTKSYSVFGPNKVDSQTANLWMRGMERTCVDSKRDLFARLVRFLSLQRTLSPSSHWALQTLPTPIRYETFLWCRSFEMRRLSLFPSRVSSQLRGLQMKLKREVKDAFDNIFRPHTQPGPGDDFHPAYHLLVNEE